MNRTGVVVSLLVIAAEPGFGKQVSVSLESKARLLHPVVEVMAEVGPELLTRAAN